jgi:hypothetical protein
MHPIKDTLDSPPDRRIDGLEQRRRGAIGGPASARLIAKQCSPSTAAGTKLPMLRCPTVSC